MESLANRCSSGEAVKRRDRIRLGIITSHPIQYNAPWFRYLGSAEERAKAMHGRNDGKPLKETISEVLSLKVFYLWDGRNQFDPGFGRSIEWDVPLLDGYEYEFVSNAASRPGPTSFAGLNNPMLEERLKNYRPDAILCFGYNYLSFYRLLFSRSRPKVPFLFRGDSHRLVRGAGLKDGLRKRWINLVFGRFDAFLFVGKANRDYFRAHGVESRRLFSSPHAVDNDRFFGRAAEAFSEALAWKNELGIPARNRVVLFAGKFESRKCPDDLINAFKRADLENTTLLLVGNGELEPELRKCAAGDRNIIFAPFQNQTQMPRTYAAGDLFVLPSFGRAETWGLSVNEAMCLGRPVIVSSHVGCARDLVCPGENGLIFPAGDVTVLAAALREALSDMDRLYKWGARSREIVRGFSYERATEGLMQALEFGLAGKPVGR